MYIHLGGDTVVKTEQLLGIFDLDTASVSKNTRQFLATMQKSGRVVSITDELPRSFAVCCEGMTTTIYLSQLSSATLKKRLNILDK